MTRLLANKRFYDERIDADDVEAHDCLFDGCVIVLTDRSKARFVSCMFRECQLVGEAWPKWIRDAAEWRAA